MKVPVVMMLDTTEPDSEPNSAEATMETLAGPPRVRPRSFSASAMKNSPPPATASTTPNTM